MYVLNRKKGEIVNQPEKTEIACNVVVRASAETQEQIVEDLMKPDPSPEEAKKILEQGDIKEGETNGQKPS